MQKFSSNTVSALQYYVYGLKYPNTERNYFYIGKGKGNRVFSHVNQKIKNGKNITLERTDVEITSQDIEGWLVANEGSLTVALDVTITDELRKEGIARELVNRIQNLRKDSGFEVTDRIEVFLQADENIENAIKLNLDYIKIETLTDELHLVEQLDKGIESALMRLAASCISKNLNNYVHRKYK